MVGTQCWVMHKTKVEQYYDALFFGQRVCHPSDVGTRKSEYIKK